MPQQGSGVVAGPGPGAYTNLRSFQEACEPVECGYHEVELFGKEIFSHERHEFVEPDVVGGADGVAEHKVDKVLEFVDKGAEC